MSDASQLPPKLPPSTAAADWYPYEEVVPPKKKCECGAAQFSSFPDNHSTWCPMFIPREAK